MVALLLTSCGSGGSDQTNESVGNAQQGASSPVEQEESASSESITWVELSRRTLVADGPDHGLSAYSLIEQFGATGSIEAPDFYPINHPEVEHIFEASDDEMGPHFVFIIHRDIDIDRDRIANDDRQRNEIKAYDQSVEELKAYQGQTFEYSWYFKVSSDMEVSSSFTHLFQLKPVGELSDFPLLTITGRDGGGVDEFEINYYAIDERTVLQKNTWSSLQGEWVSVKCLVTFDNNGYIEMSITRRSDNQVLINVIEENIDTWRSTQEEDFVRPKWGIYRSLLDFDNLRSEEEQVRFANFMVRRLEPEATSKHSINNPRDSH